MSDGVMSHFPAMIVGPLVSGWLSLQPVLAADNPEAENFDKCLIAQYDARKYPYTSSDGGRSVLLLMSECDLHKYVAGCVAAGGGSEVDCRKKAAIVAGIFIKLKESGFK